MHQGSWRDEWRGAAAIANCGSMDGGSHSRQVGEEKKPGYTEKVHADSEPGEGRKRRCSRLELGGVETKVGKNSQSPLHAALSGRPPQNQKPLSKRARELARWHWLRLRLWGKGVLDRGVASAFLWPVACRMRGGRGAFLRRLRWLVRLVRQGMNDDEWDSGMDRNTHTKPLPPAQKISRSRLGSRGSEFESESESRLAPNSRRWHGKIDDKVPSTLITM